MSWYIKDREVKLAPQEYQDHVTAIGGRNRFGEPNFRIVWGQTGYELVYGIDAHGRRGQHIIPKHSNIPAWFVEAWKPPECFGTPEMWYTISWDPESMTHTLGDFPWRGLYMSASFNLYVSRIVGGTEYYDEHGAVRQKGGRLEIDAMPLNHLIIDLTIPNLIKEKEITYLQRKAAIQNVMLGEKMRANQKAFDAYLNAGPAFGGKAGTYESNREAWMQRLKEKQKGMRFSAEEIKRRLGTGHTQIR